MKQLFPFLLLFILAGCSDGDLQIETIDFDSVPVQFCGSKATTSTRVFFKISSDEALILELQSGVLKNKVSDGALISTVPGQSKLIYRIFSDDVSKSYFCNNVPQSAPVVAQEITAAAGEVLVTTVKNPTDTTAFQHTIELSGISLINEQGERITDLSINEFGAIITTP